MNGDLLFLKVLNKLEWLRLTSFASPNGQCDSCSRGVLRSEIASDTAFAAHSTNRNVHMHAHARQIFCFTGYPSKISIARSPLLLSCDPAEGSLAHTAKADEWNGLSQEFKRNIVF
jgi:hypothetical protein